MLRPHRMRSPRTVIAAATALCTAALAGTLLAGPAAAARPAPLPHTTRPRPPRRPEARRGGQQGRRILHQLGCLRPQLPRQEHRDLGLGGQADPHQLRLRQRSGRQVRHRRLLRRLRQGLHRRPERRRQGGHLGQRRAARQLQPAAQAQEAAPGTQGDLVVRRLDLVGRLRRSRQEPRRLRPVLPRPGRGQALGGCLRRHRHRLGVPQRLRPDLRHQWQGRLHQGDEGAALGVRPEQSGDRGDHR